LLQHLDAFGDLALLQRQHRDVIQRVEVLRIALQHRDIALHRQVALALAVERQRLLDSLLRFLLRTFG
jgi:hypothetical protein